MKAYFSLTVFAGVILLAPQWCYAAEADAYCPSDLVTEAVQIVQVPAGWTPSTPHRLRLTAVGMMAGAPATRAELKPDGGHTFKNGSVETWDLKGDMPDGKWLSCQYGEDAVRLGRRLDDATTACSVTYTKTKPYGRMAIEVRCIP